ncbi:MAG: HIT domain-containing protein [Patescibacteria group bacterium]|nr:MAG: HIT domain-containing protein [Patescibacteria group bacterium]
MSNKYDFYCEEALLDKTAIDIVFESDNILAFNHTNPSYQTHIVTIPKKHIIDLPSLADEDLGILNEPLRVARDISRKLDKSQGIRLRTNAGKFQDTPHLHFHLIDGEKL